MLIIVYDGCCRRNYPIDQFWFINDRLAFSYRYFPTSLQKQNGHKLLKNIKNFPNIKKSISTMILRLRDYKFIYFWEWFHRFIGRIIGLVFIVPFVYFLFKKRLSTATIKKCVVLLLDGRFSRIFRLVYGTKRFNQ